jgi:formamidopyrimidine-DNA glycosylase
MVMTLSDGTKVVFNDARRFGLIDLAVTKDLEKHRFFLHLGPEPFDKSFHAEYLAGKLENKKIAIKLAIMDQRLVVGIGNIYASEALFLAGIDPRRAAKTLKTGEIRKLASAIRKTLQQAIKAGGSSLRDYVQADGEPGYFQHRWAVYGKEGEKCRGCTCKTGRVQRITQGGRSTFYCPAKQK